MKVIFSFVFENIIEMNGYYLYKNCNNNSTWLNSSMLYSDNISRWKAVMPNYMQSTVKRVDRSVFWLA